MIESPLTPEQQRMLIAWQQHTYTEFALRDAQAALATMTENPYVLLVPSGAGGEGRTAVLDFYAHSFLPYIPLDLELTPVSRIFGRSHLIEESVVRFTHSVRMNWMLPGLEPTGRRVEFVLVGIVGLQNDRVAYEHLYWDQGTVLSQLGVPSHPAAKSGIESASALLRLTKRREVASAAR